MVLVAALRELELRAAVGASTGELIVQSARASLGLLVAHQQAGGSVPADVIALCARLSQTGSSS